MIHPKRLLWRFTTMAITKSLTIFPKQKKSKINKEIYGHFSEHLGRCIYNGIYVGENSDIPNTNGMRNDVVAALKDINVPVLRWPGGCFADEYHWMNGIGPKEGRMKMINTHWGGVTEDNSFGTHEFMELCKQLDCEPYISGNVGSGTVRELSEWIEYMTSNNISPMADLRRKNGQEEPWHVKYLGIGNENWGCGGNMLPEYYASVYRQFQTYCRNYGDNQLYKVACGPNAGDYHWTEEVMKRINPFVCNALSLHFYTVPNGWVNKGSATGFDQKGYYDTLQETLKIKDIIKGHLEIMDRYDPEHKIGLIVDEWGTWWEVEPGTNPGFLYQQNTMRDAMVAAINLNLFNHNSDRIVMANIAQIVNVLQSVILTEGDKMLKTPTYHVFKMFKDHQGSTLVESALEDTTVKHGECEIPDISESASVDSEGRLVITLANANLDEDYVLSTRLIDAVEGCPCCGIKTPEISAEILSAEYTAFNTFEEPDTVAATSYDGVTLVKNDENDALLSITVPAGSIVKVIVK